MTQIRLPKYKRKLLKDEKGNYKWLGAPGSVMNGVASRIGYQNDGFGAGPSEGWTWPEAPYFGNPGNPEHDMMTVESPYVAVDGEMFYINFGGMINGLWAAERLRLHHYSSLGIFQSNAAIEAPGKTYSVDKWAKTMIGADDLSARRLPHSITYFTDKNGKTVKRSIFDYLRDHLGYRIELQKFELPVKVAQKSKLAVKFSLINYGFSAPVKPRKCYLVLRHKGGDFFPLSTKINVRKWQPFKPGDKEFRPLEHRYELSIDLPDYISSGEYQVGIWLPDSSSTLRNDPRYAMRLANRSVTWEPKWGINLIGKIEVERSKKPKQLMHLILDPSRNKESIDSSRGIKAIPGKRVYQVKSPKLEISKRDPYSIVTWISTNKQNSSGVILGRYNGGVAGQYFLSKSNGRLIFSREMKPYAATATEIIKPNRVYQVAAVYDGRRQSIFVDSKLVAAEWIGPVRPIDNSKVPFTIGGQLYKNKPTRIFDGNIYEIMFLDQPLTATELKKLQPSSKY